MLTVQLFALNQNQILKAVKKVKKSATLQDISSVICGSNGGNGNTENCNAVWLQCGGQGFSGPNCCKSGLTCKNMNPWYSQCIPGSVTPTPTVTVTPTSTPTAIPTTGGSIPISSGTSATLTRFDDNVTQCFGSNVPAGNGCAVNPLLLGFTENQWTTLYKNASPNQIDWCGKQLTLTVNGASWTCTIIDSIS